MSDLKPPSKSRQEQNAWIARVLDVQPEQYGRVRNTLDKYGLDAPRTNDEPVTRQRGAELDPQKADPQGPRRARLLQAVTVQDNALASEPQAKVPERDTARDLGAKAAKLLEKLPIDADAAGKAVEAYQQAVSLAVAAMRKVRADQANLAKQEKELQPPAEVDDDGQAKLGELTQLRQKIEALVTGEEPSPDDIDAAGKLLDEYRKVAQELADEVAKRLRERLAAAKETGEKLMAYMKKQYEPVEPSVFQPLQQQYIDFTNSLTPPMLTVQAVKDAEGKLKQVRETGRSLNGILGAAKKQRAALQEKLKNLEAPALPGLDWGKAVNGRLTNARVKVQNALDAPLSPDGVTEADQQVQGFADQIAIANRMPAIWAKVEKAMTRVDELDVDLLTSEQQKCGTDRLAVGAQLRQLAGPATDKADELADTLLDDVNDLDQVVVDYYGTITAQRQQWTDEEGRYLKLQQQVQRKQPPVDGSAAFSQFTDLKQRFSDNLKQRRRPCDVTLLDTGVSQLRTLCGTLRQLLGQNEEQAAEQIGWDPFNGGDQTTLYGYYTQIGGAGQLQEFLTVCQKASKAGGHYTYKGTKHTMYHDSHGPKNGNEQSRTAWKIVVDGKIQVVGVGYHKGNNYRAIFPHAGGAGDYAASNEIIDPRTQG